MYGDAREEIRAKLAIEDIIGEYVHLKRAGRYWKGLSPFTNEKTPSFYVTPDKDIWHDFSSGRGGDIFSFIMEIEGLDFRGALELLARKAGVDLSLYQKRGNANLSALKERIYQMNNLAVNYFQHHLINSKIALNYVSERRHLSRDTVYNWGIGYAPNHPNLTKVLADKGYKTSEMKQAGLLGYSGREMFFDRLMIPLRDRNGQVVGFTGRIIGQGEPKYLNTPDTILYHKGQQLFGLNFAIQAIRQANAVVLVEGNLDVISSHQAGVKNVVGVAGTALTTEHLKTLSRLTNNIKLCFDSDRAGVAATERAIALAGPLELKLSVVDFSETKAKDPDELINLDCKLWQQAIAKSQLAVNWVRDYYIKTNGVSSVDAKKLVVDKTLSVIASLSDPVEREGYIRELSQATTTSVQSLVNRLAMLDSKSTAGRHLKKTSVKKQSAIAMPREQRFRYLDNTLAYLGLNLEMRDKYINKLAVDNLSAVDRELVNYLKKERCWGDDLIKLVATARDQGDTELEQAVIDKINQLQILNDRAKESIEGIKSEAELLDYMCHFEYNYYKNQAKVYMAQSAELSSDDSRLIELSDQAGKARQMASYLDPGKNRRNNYQGLKKLWQTRAIKLGDN